jgi:HK97 family phage major capsid protein
MNLDEMNLQQVTERLAALDIEVREAKDIETVEKLGAEKKELLERKAELEALEQRKQTALDITAGKIIPNVIEIRKDTKMEDIIYTRESQEYRSAWLKNLKGEKLTEVEERAYAATSAAGAIPTATAETLFAKMTKLAPMLSEITLLRVAGNVQFATQGARSAATIHTENATITAATDTLVAVTLGGYEYNKLLYVSKTVQTMAINAFEGWLVDMIAEDIAICIGCNH